MMHAYSLTKYFEICDPRRLFDPPRLFDTKEYSFSLKISHLVEIMYSSLSWSYLSIKVLNISQGGRLFDIGRLFNPLDLFLFTCFE